MSITLSALQQQRRDTAANWTSANPTLLAGEIGVETDTGLLKIGDGSTAWTSLDYLPLSFEGYAANGIYNPAANQVALATNGTGRLFIDSSGNIGVGTASVSTKLVVAGSNNGSTNNNTLRFVDTDTSSSATQESGRIEFFTSDSTQSGVHSYIAGQTFDTLGNGGLTFGTGTAGSATEAVRIDSSGRLLVGKTNATSGALLQIQGISTNSTSYGYMSIHRGSIPSGANDDLGYITFEDSSNNQGVYIQARRDGGTWTSGSSHPTYLAFWTTADGASSPTERMRIDSSGNVGINKTPATYQLEVNGGTANTVASFESTDATSRIRFADNTGEAFVGGEGNAVTFYNGSSATERMRIDSSGNVGIGTSSPARQLTLYNSSTPIIQLVNSTTGQTANDGVMLYESGSDFVIENQETGNIRIYNAGTERMRIDSSGNVGIGGTPTNDANTTTFEVITDATTARMILTSNAVGGGKYGWYTNNEGQLAAYDYTAASERMRIDSSGRLLVGTTSAVTSTNAQHSKLQVIGNTNGATGGYLVLGRAAAAASAGQTLGEIYFTDNTAGQYASIRCDADAATGSGDHPGRLVFSTTADGDSSPTERMRIDKNGNITNCVGIYNNTTAAAANVFVGSAGDLGRSTSSAKYKTDIESIENSYSDALLNCRPVWYRSTCEGDNPAHGWWGFIAEEVAAIDPRLVHWKTVEITYDENGSAVKTPCDPEPEGVAYDRFVPHLLNLIKRQQAAIETFEQRLTDAGL